MRDAYHEEMQREARGAVDTEGARRRQRQRQRPVDGRLMDLLAATEARMATLLTAPHEARMRADHQSAVSRTAEELSVYGKAVLARLTWREVEVWRLESAGHGSAAIADELHIAVATAKTHMKHVRAKIKAAREQRLPLT